MLLIEEVDGGHLELSGPHTGKQSVQRLMEKSCILQLIAKLTVWMRNLSERGGRGPRVPLVINVGLLFGALPDMQDFSI